MVLSSAKDDFLRTNSKQIVSFFKTNDINPLFRHLFGRSFAKLYKNLSGNEFELFINHLYNNLKDNFNDVFLSLEKNDEFLIVPRKNHDNRGIRQLDFYKKNTEKPEFAIELDPVWINHKEDETPESFRNFPKELYDSLFKHSKEFLTSNSRSGENE